MYDPFLPGRFTVGERSTQAFDAARNRSFPCDIYCAVEDRGVTSVQLLKGDTVAWSYSVNKGRGQKNRQFLAEAIAKHLKSDYFKR